MVRTKLTRYLNVRDQIDTIERKEIKLKYDVKDRDQLYNLALLLLLICHMSPPLHHFIIHH